MSVSKTRKNKTENDAHNEHGEIMDSKPHCSTTLHNFMFLF